jgi:hypothetical protein
MVLKTIDEEHLFSEYIDSFSIPIIQIRTIYKNPIDPEEQLKITYYTHYNYVFPFVKTFKGKLEETQLEIMIKELKDITIDFGTKSKLVEYRKQYYDVIPFREKQKIIFVPIHIQAKLEGYLPLDEYANMRPNMIFMNKLNIFFDKIKKLGKTYNYIHNDAHLSNIMINSGTYELKFIDYGRNYFDKTKLPKSINIDETIFDISNRNEGINPGEFSSLNNANCCIGPKCIDTSSSGRYIGYMFDISTITMGLLNSCPNINIAFHDVMRFENFDILINKKLVEDASYRAELVHANPLFVYLYNGIIWFYNYINNIDKITGTSYIIHGEETKQINYKNLVKYNVIHSYFQFISVQAKIYDSIDDTNLCVKSESQASSSITQSSESSSSTPSLLTKVSLVENPSPTPRKLIIDDQRVIKKNPTIWKFVKNFTVLCFGFEKAEIHPQIPLKPTPVQAPTPVHKDRFASLEGSFDAIVMNARDKRRQPIGSSFDREINLPGQVPVSGGKKQHGGNFKLTSSSGFEMETKLLDFLNTFTDDDFLQYVRNKTARIMYKHADHLAQTEIDDDLGFLQELYLLMGSPPPLSVFEKIKLTSEYKNIQLEKEKLFVSHQEKQRESEMLQRVGDLPISKGTRLPPNVPRPPTSRGRLPLPGVTAGGSNKIRILGRDRKITKIGRVQYITYNKQVIKLVDARKLEKLGIKK